MIVQVLGVMIPIIVIIGTVIMILYLRKYKNEERMAMIEKGVSLDFLKGRRLSSTSLPLRMSLLLIGGGVGLLMGYFLNLNFNMDEVGYFSMLFIFGGLGLGASYLIEEKKIKDEQKNG